MDTLAVAEQADVTEQADALTARYELARWTGHAGDLVAARDLVAKSSQHSNAHGPGHPRTLGILNELARRAGQAGDPAAARDRLVNLLTVLKRGPWP